MSVSTSSTHQQIQRMRTHGRALGHIGPGRGGSDSLEAEGSGRGSGPAGNDCTAGCDAQSGEHRDEEGFNVNMG